MKETPQRQRITRAIVSLVTSEHAFFAQIALHLEVVETKKYPALATDGRSLLFRPEWVDTVANDELRTAIVHEVMHVAMMHPYRMRGRDQHDFNVAADHAVNLSLADYTASNGSKPFRIPQSWLCDPQYTGLSAEQIYDRVHQEPEPEPEPDDQGNDDDQQQDQDDPQGQPQESQDGQGGTPDESEHPAANGPTPGELLPYPGTAQEAQEAQTEMEQAVMQAAQAAAAQHGSLPGELRRLVDEMRKPSVDWRAALRAFLTRAQDDWTWKRPNRRLLSSGTYLPGRDSERCGPIVVAVDTSGSIDDRTLAVFSAELNSIIAETRPESVTVIYCDAAINADPITYLPDDAPITLEPHGGGGTDFRPVFQWVETNGTEPAALVYLTDMLGFFPACPPIYPVLWASTTDQTAHFGETVRVDAP